MATKTGFALNLKNGEAILWFKDESRRLPLTIKNDEVVLRLSHSFELLLSSLAEIGAKDLHTKSSNAVRRIQAAKEWRSHSLS